MQRYAVFFTISNWKLLQSKGDFVYCHTFTHRMRLCVKHCAISVLSVRESCVRCTLSLICPVIKSSNKTAKCAVTCQIKKNQSTLQPHSTNSPVVLWIRVILYCSLMKTLVLSRDFYDRGHYIIITTGLTIIKLSSCLAVRMSGLSIGYFSRQICMMKYPFVRCFARWPLEVRIKSDTEERK